MKLRTTLAVGVLSLLSLNSFASKFEVTVQNLTKGQPIAPPLVIAHSPRISLFHVGEKASKGIEVMAQDGDTSVLEAELANNQAVFSKNKGVGPILPGEKQTVIIETKNPYEKLSVLAMVARTNDGFVGAKNLATNLKTGSSYSVLAEVYDAGAEMNTESCDTIPAPPCNNPKIGTNGGEGFVRPHEGIQGIGDLELARDSFASKSAKVTIKRVH